MSFTGRARAWLAWRGLVKARLEGGVGLGSGAVLGVISTMVELSLELIQKLPKTDLHVHLDGSMRIETVLDLAREQSVTLPADTVDGLRKALRLGQCTGSLVEYLKAFDVTLQVLQVESALYRAAFELAEDAAAENVRYMEVRYSPMLHTRAGLRLTTVVEAVLRGLQEARLKHGITSRLILCGIRNISASSSMRMAELVVAYKGRGVVGFDLAGAEYDYPPKNHQEAFNLVRRNNVNVTIHAGEAYGPASIAQALHDCGAHRIGHGCRLREDGDLLRYVIDHRIPLECCPSSNVQTGAVRDLNDHPMRLYHNLGARVTVNTDNRMVTDTTVSRELFLVHKHLEFGFEDLCQVILNGFKSAFMPHHEKQHYMRKIATELEEFARAHADVPDVYLNSSRPPGSQPHKPIKNAS
ncbi:MAG: adenosine deaminase [Nannocystaceae bacterium]